MLDNKTIVSNYIDQIWRKRNKAAIDEYLSPDYVQQARGIPSGREGVKDFFDIISNAFAELDYRVEDIIADGDKVCWRFVLSGRHTGKFQGVEATGKTITLTGISLVRLVNGQIVEHWGVQDMLGLMQQFGVIPAPGQE